MDKFRRQAERELKKLIKKRDLIEAQIKAIMSYLEVAPISQVPKKKSRDTVVDKIIRVFYAEKRPMHYTEIIELLDKYENYKFLKSKDPKGTITAILSVNPQFVRVDRGIYTLKEWKEIEEKEKKENELAFNVGNKEMAGE